MSSLRIFNQLLNATLLVLIILLSGNTTLKSEEVGKWASGYAMPFGASHGTIFNYINSGTIYSILTTDDEIYVSGLFYTVGGAPASSVAVYHPSKNHWETLLGDYIGGLSNDCMIFDMALDSAGNLYVAGKFTNFAGQNITNFAKYDGEKWQDMGIKSMDGDFRCVEVATDGKVYLGGRFSKINDNNVSHGMVYYDQDLEIYVSLEDGVDPDTPVDQNTWMIWTMSIDQKSNVYIGGEFKKFGNQTSSSKLLRWDGTILESVQMPIDNPSYYSGAIYDIIIDDGDIIVAGGFSYVRYSEDNPSLNIMATNIAMYSGGEWSSIIDNSQKGYDNCQNIALSDDALYVCSENKLFQIQYGVETEILNNTYLNDLAIYNGSVVIGGLFEYLEGDDETLFGGLAGYIDSKWVPLYETNDFGLNQSIGQLQYYDSYLLASGKDYKLRGNGIDVDSKAGLVAYDDEEWTAVPETDDIVINEMIVYNDELYVAGTFDSIGSAKTKNLAKFSAYDWASVGSGLAKPSGSWALAINDMAVAEGKLYLAGWFESIDNPDIDNLATWDGTSFASIGTKKFSRVFNVAVGNIAGQGFTVFVAAKRTTTSTKTDIFQYLNGEWTTIREDVYLTALTVHNDSLFAAGNFQIDNDRSRLSKWDGSAWTDLILDSQNQGVQYVVINEMLSVDDSLIVAGNFQQINGKKAISIACYYKGEFSDMDTGLTGLITDAWRQSPGIVYDMAYLDEGLLFVGGEFRKAGEYPSAFIAEMRLKSPPISSDVYVSFPDTNNIIELIDGYNEYEAATVRFYSDSVKYKIEEFTVHFNEIISDIKKVSVIIGTHEYNGEKITGTDLAYKFKCNEEQEAGTELYAELIIEFDFPSPTNDNYSPCPVNGVIHFNLSMEKDDLKITPVNASDKVVLNIGKDDKITSPDFYLACIINHSAELRDVALGGHILTDVILSDSTKAKDTLLVGPWEFVNEVPISKSVIIYGDSGDNINTKFSSLASFRSAFEITSDDVEIYNMNIYADEADQSTLPLVHIKPGCKNVKIENNMIRNGNVGLMVENSGKNIISSNIIIDNIDCGIIIRGSQSAENALYGNKIGVDEMYKPHPNANGLRIDNAASDNYIGPEYTHDDDSTNIIAANENANIYISGLHTTGNIFTGNAIGASPKITARIESRYGVLITDSASSNAIGMKDNSMNLIGNNKVAGVYVKNANENFIVENFIGCYETDDIYANGYGILVDGLHLPDDKYYYTATISNNIISGNNADGVHIRNSDNISIHTNCIGLDYGAEVAIPNLSNGIVLVNSYLILIGLEDTGEYNIISGNKGNGILISEGSNYNYIIGNIIGAAAGGNRAIPNESNGIQISGAHDNYIGCTGDSNSVRKTVMNIISGNLGNGIVLDMNTEYTYIMSNNIGCDYTGSAEIANEGCGILIKNANHNIIGDTLYEHTNIISGNMKDGINISGKNAYSNIIIGNVIGLDAANQSALANEGNGIVLGPGANYNDIGAKGNIKNNCYNVIAGNKGNGIVIGGAGSNSRVADSNIVYANYLGIISSTGATIPNQENGILIEGNAQNNVIGPVADYDDNMLPVSIICNNKNGIKLSGKKCRKNSIAHCHIGFQYNVENPSGNSLNGILVTDKANNNVIGSQESIADADARSFNYIGNNGSHGIEISNSAFNNDVSGNIIGLNFSRSEPARNQKYCIAITGSGTHNNNISRQDIIHSNLCVGAEQGGIYVEGANNIVHGNIIGYSESGQSHFDNEGPAITVTGSSSNTKVINNTYSYNQGGTVDNGFATLIAGNYAHHTGSTGITLGAGSEAKVIGNMISNNPSDGIKLLPGANPFIRKNNLFDNEGLGVLAEDEQADIKAQFNWWGDAQGPDGSNGDGVSANVNTENFLTESIKFIAAFGTDTLELAAGVADSCYCHFINWEESARDISVQFASGEQGLISSETEHEISLMKQQSKAVKLVLNLPGDIEPEACILVTVEANSGSLVDYDTLCIKIYDPVISDINIETDRTVFAANETVDLDAILWDQKGNVISGDYSWASDKGSISEDGIIESADLELGDIQVTASTENSVADTVIISITDAVTLDLPANEAENIGLFASFQWSANIEYYGKYFLELATDQAFSDIVIADTINGQSYFMEEALEKSSTYYWRISYYLENDVDRQTAVHSFTTGEYMPVIENNTLESIGAFVYPNPTKGLVTIQLPEQFSELPLSIFIYDANGICISRQNNVSGSHNVNLGDSPSGVYFVKIFDNDHEQIIKLIRQ